MISLLQFLRLYHVSFTVFGCEFHNGNFIPLFSLVGNFFGELRIGNEVFLFAHVIAEVFQVSPRADYLTLLQQNIYQATFYGRHLFNFRCKLIKNENRGAYNFINNFEMKSKEHIFAFIMIYDKKMPRSRARTTKRIFKQVFLHRLKTVKVMENLAIKTTNEFQEAHDEFLNSTLHQRLAQKFRVEPFYKRYRKLKNVLSVSSYGLNFFSAATAFTCVFVFLNTLLQNNLIAGLFSIGFLAVVEILKRLTIPDFFKNYLQFGKINVLKIVFIMGLTATSVGLSYLGAKDSVKMFTPSVQLLSVDSVKSSYTSRIADLEERLKDVKKTQSWRGKLTAAGQKTYNQISAQIASIEDDMLKNTNRVTDRNEDLQVKHSSKTEINAHFFGLFTLGLDLSLIIFLFFVEYYDYRSLTEFSQTTNPQYNDRNAIENITETSNTGIVATNMAKEVHDIEISDNAVATDLNGADEGVLRLAIKNAKANLAAYEAKLRNREGNEDTIRRGIERWKNTLVELESRFQFSNT